MLHMERAKESEHERSRTSGLICAQRAPCYITRHAYRRRRQGSDDRFIRDKISTPVLFATDVCDWGTIDPRAVDGGGRYRFCVGGIGEQVR